MFIRVGPCGTLILRTAGQDEQARKVARGASKVSAEPVSLRSGIQAPLIHSAGLRVRAVVDKAAGDLSQVPLFAQQLQENLSCQTPGGDAGALLTLRFLEDMSSASRDSCAVGSNWKLRPCMKPRADSLASGKSIGLPQGDQFSGTSKSIGMNNRKRKIEDVDVQRKAQLDDLGLQRPLLIGPFRDFGDALVKQVVDRFGGAVQSAQVMKGTKSQSERSSLMLWLSSRTRITPAGDRGWPLTILDPTGTTVVVEDLQDVFPVGVEQEDRPVCVQQADKHFVPGPVAFKPGATK